MNINQILEEKEISKYKLAKLSGVPYTTLNDICSGQARIEKCSAETLYKIAKVLEVTIEDLIEESMNRVRVGKDYMAFDNFKSNVCHKVKDSGDIPFIIETLEADEIGQYYRAKQYEKAFYLLAMVDYLSRENELPLCTNYSDIRKQKLAEPIYPNSIIALAKVTGDETVKEKSLDESIPEFKEFNIVENEVRNVI